MSNHSVESDLTNLLSIKLGVKYGSSCAVVCCVGYDVVVDDKLSVVLYLMSFCVEDLILLDLSTLDNILVEWYSFCEKKYKEKKRNIRANEFNRKEGWEYFNLYIEWFVENRKKKKK